MAARIRAFRQAGCHSRVPPHDPGEQASWIAAAEEYWELFQELRDENPDDPRFQDPQLAAGIDFLQDAIRKPSCIVALQGMEPLAALSFQVRPDKHVFAGMLGSNGKVKGAAMAVEFELAKIARSAGLRVDAMYIRGSRGFHLAICRSLDLGPGPLTSRWTAEDCAVLVAEIEARL
jgi:hypothetical protein